MSTYRTAIVIIGILITWHQLSTNQTAISPQNIQTIFETQPSTEKPSPEEITKHTVAPDEPRYIFIEKIDVKAAVRSLGVTADNSLEAPNIRSTSRGLRSAALIELLK